MASQLARVSGLAAAEGQSAHPTTAVIGKYAVKYLNSASNFNVFLPLLFDNVHPML